MIKAKAVGPDGRALLVLGLSFTNLDRLRANAGDRHIRIDGKEMGLPVDVMIFAGETEAHCVETIKGGIGTGTMVHVDDKLKS